MNLGIVGPFVWEGMKERVGLGGEKQDVNCIGGLCTLCDADLGYVMATITEGRIFDLK